MKGDKLRKQKQEEEEKENGVEEVEEEKEGAEKSVKGSSEKLTKEDLEKSLTQLESEVAKNDSSSRKDQLLEKAKVKDLEKAEKEELFQLLGEEFHEGNSLGKSVTEGLQTNEDLQKALDVSDYLREQHSELTTSLEMLADEISKSDNRQHQFNLLLAKAVADTGRLVKSMAERLGVIEQQPAREPKAKRSLAQPMEKGFAGQPSGEQLSKSQILDTLESMIADSVEKGRAGNTEDGIDLTVAASKVEQFGTIHPALLERIKSFRSRGNATS